MALTGNGFTLGINLGVNNEQSKKNINQYIEGLRNLETVKVDLDVSKTNQGLKQTNEQLSQLKGSNVTFSNLTSSIEKANKALEKLERTGYSTPETINKLRGALTNIPDGDLNRVRSAIADINDELGRVNITRSVGNTIERLQVDLKNLDGQLNKTKNLYQSTFDRQVAERLSHNIRTISTDLATLPKDSLKVTQKQIDDIRNRINATKSDIAIFNSEATTAVRNSVGVVDALRTAFEKFPIWILASSVFFGLANGIKDITATVIELDTAMTNLIRVSDGASYEFEQFTSRAIADTTELSGVLSDFMTLVTEFARTGKTIDESFDLARTTQTLVNISDLTANEAVDALTASMINFNISAEDSIRIADRLNEVDNNFAITTQDLAVGLQKAGSTAKTFGVDIDNLIGNITAIGSVTRESGAIVGNSLRTIYARITTNSNAISALQNIGISIEDLNGKVRPVQEIMKELAETWDTLSDAERQNTSVSVAGIYQLSRFNALLNNYQISLDATATSIDSYNSSAREQEAYNESLQARINRLNTAWQSLANTLGNTIVSDALVVGTEALNAFAKAGENAVVANLGFSSVIGAMGVGVFLLTNNFRGFITTLIQTTASTRATSASATGLTGSLYALASGATAASVAFRTLLASTGIGLAVVGITSAITYFTGKISENIQEQEKFDTYLEQNALALTDNKAKVDELLKSYDRLSASDAGGGLSPEEAQEYLNVQNQLAELFPGIIDSVDANGNAHLKTRAEIDKEIEATAELINKQRELDGLGAQDTFKDLLKDIEKLNKERAGLQTVLEVKIDRGASKTVIAETEFEILQLDKQIADSSAEISNNVLKISDAFIDFGTELNSTVDGEIRDAISGLDFSKLDPKELETFSKRLADIRVELNKTLEANDQSGFEKARADLQALYSTASGSSKELNVLALNFDKVKKATTALGESLNPVLQDLGETGEVSEDLANKINDLQEAMLKLSSAEEQLVGVSYNTVESSENLLFVYEQLTRQLSQYTEQELISIQERQRAGESLSVSERAVIDTLNQRADTLVLLNTIYPEFTKLQEGSISLSKDQVKAIENEEKANKTLLEAYKLLKEGKLSAEQEATLYQAQGTKARIDNIRKEILAINTLNQELQKYVDGINKAQKAGETSEEYRRRLDNEAKASMRASSIQASNDNKVSDSLAELDRLQASLNTSIGTISASNKAISESSKTKKADAKSTRESIYYSDKYKQSLEKLNLEIEKQKSIQEGQLKHSQTYIKSLRTELSLENQKIALMKAQARELEKQIKSGKFKQTGNVTFETGTSTSGSKNVKVNGFGGRITSGQGYRIHPVTGKRSYHEGIDIAGARGSRLDSVADGKVVKAGYNSISGNYIKIEDSKGYQAFYGHLDKAFAKLGDVVKAGQQIGTIGATGRATGSHLHFQVSKGGKLQSALDYSKSARNGTASTSGGSSNSPIKTSSGAYVTGQQAEDEARLNLIELEKTILEREKRASEIDQQIFEALRSGYQFRRDNADATIEYEQAKIQNVDFATSRYGKTLDIIVKQLEIKQKANDDEIRFLDEYAKKNKLSSEELNNLRNSQLELKKSTQELIAEMAKLELDRVNNSLEMSTSKYSQTIEYERTKLAELDTTSARYGKTLEIITRNLQANQRATRNSITELNIMIKSGTYTGQALQDMKDRVHELTLEIGNLAQEISNNNFEIIVNIKSNADDAIDDIQFLIDKSQALQKFTKEGSAEYNAEIIKQVELYKQIAEARNASRIALEQELQQRDLLPERIKEITELLEDETTAYLSALNSVQSLVKNAEEAGRNQLEKIYNDVINAYKEYVRERREEHIKQLDDERKREDENHERRQKQLSDELDLFKRNIDEKRKALDRADAERGYNQDIDELESERNKLQERFNDLLLDDSREAGVERKKLQEEIDKVDKNISERQYDRDLELQRQGLDDLEETKDREIDLLEEAEDRRYKIETDRIDRLKQYYEKYYNDLLNDERKFAQLRTDILAGNFEKVASDFGMYIGEMQATLPLLQDTFDGTMTAVGTAIRQNVIDNLQNALKLFDEFKTSQESLSGIGANLDGFTDNFDPNKYKPKPGSDGNFTGISGSGGATQGQKFTEADAKVIVGKYLTEVLRHQETNKTRATNIQNKAYALATQGRKEGSTIPSDKSLNSVVGGLSYEDKNIVRSYINSNAGNLFQTDYLIDKLRRFGASLDTGGYLNFSGKGIDGKGGHALIGHPGEIMLNPVEVKELLAHSENLKHLFANNGSFERMIAGSNLGSNSPVQEIYNVQFGDVLNTTQNGAKQFAKEFVDDVRSRKGGGFR